MAEPIAYCEFEGGYYYPWQVFAKGQHNPERVHSIHFDDGSAFDTVNGWRNGPDAEELARVQSCLKSEYWRTKPAGNLHG